MRRHGFSPSALLAALVLLLVGPHAMASGGEPAAPGSPDYWVELQSMSFTQGHLEPAFDPDTADYVLMIHNPKVERFSVALTLQTTKYDLMFVPKIIVNDKEFKYSPLEPISPEFMVNETIGEEDKIVTIRLEDPSGCTGWFCKPRGFDYKIRVRQAPEFEKVVLAKSVLVTAPDGSRLWPEEADDEKEEQDDEAHEDQTMRESQYTFVIPDNFSAATIKASCGEYATRTLINGQAAQNGQEVAVQMSAAEETTFFTCAYDNKMWTQNTVARTYQVHFVRKGANKAEPPYVLMMPQVGRCELQRPLGEPKATPHYACQTAFQYVQLVTKYDDPMTEHVYLDDVDGEQGTITLSNGVETSQIPVVKKVHKFKLRMEGLNKAQFDLTVIQSAHCDEMDCPSGYVMAAALNSISANAHMCKGFKCDPAVDSETCCRRAGAPCEDFGKRYNCPKPYKLFTDDFCVGFPCKSADARYCCIGETGFFGALEGIRIQKHWDKVDKEITASLARELEYLDFNVIIDHISDSKKFAKVQKVSPAIQSVVSKLLGVPNGDVSVQTAAIADGIAQAFIRIQSLAGNARNEQLRKKLEEDLQHADKVGADLVKALKSVWDGDLQVAKVSPVERNKPTAPVAEEKILVLVPTSAKLLDSRDAEDQVGSALRVVMEEELKDSTLGLKDNQVTCSFSSVKDPPSGIPAGLTAVSVTVQIKFKVGDEGSAEMATAKLKEIVHQQIDELLKQVLTKKGHKVKKSLLQGIKVLKVDVEEPTTESTTEFKPAFITKTSTETTTTKTATTETVTVTSRTVTSRTWTSRIPKTSSTLTSSTLTSSTITASSTSSTTSASTTWTSTTLADDYVLSVWLGMTKATTTMPPVQMIMITTNAGQCISAPNRHKLGGKVVAEPCHETWADHQWTYTIETGQIQNTFGICLAADFPGHTQSSSSVQGGTSTDLLVWIEQKGATSAVMWKCESGWQERWEYLKDSGQFRIVGSPDPGLCLESASPGVKGTSLQLNLCSASKFSQQFWFNEVEAFKYLPSGFMPARDMPVFVKPYFDGEVARKGPDGTYSDFELAPFAKKRAAFYLTQGCSPMPTQSCGPPQTRDMPDEHVGASMLAINEDVDQFPWQVAISGSKHKDLPGTCVYDPSCAEKPPEDASSSGSPDIADLKMWTAGCKAGSKSTCRYCGYGGFAPCPGHYDCNDGGLQLDIWSEGKKKWCCEKFSVGCQPWYDCLDGIETWKTTWSAKKQSWCCQYQEVGCVDECSKEDPETWNENHVVWCNTFGNAASQSLRKPQPSKKSEFAQIELKYEEGKATAWVLRRPENAWVSLMAAACVLLAATAWVWASRLSRRASDLDDFPASSQSRRPSRRLISGSDSEQDLLRQAML